MNQPDPLRGTGRTTAGMLRAIAHALENPNEWVPFTDYSGPCRAEGDYFAYQTAIRNIIAQLGLNITTGMHHRAVKCIVLRSDVERLKPEALTNPPPVPYAGEGKWTTTPGGAFGIAEGGTPPPTNPPPEDCKVTGFPVVDKDGTFLGVFENGFLKVSGEYSGQIREGMGIYFNPPAKSKLLSHMFPRDWAQFDVSSSRASAIRDRLGPGQILHLPSGITHEKWTCGLYRLADGNYVRINTDGTIEEKAQESETKSSNPFINNQKTDDVNYYKDH